MQTCGYKNYCIAFLLATIAAILTGCQSTAPKEVKVEPPPLPPKPAMENLLYLRAVFTWWDAEEQYRVKKVGENVYQAQARLVADGEYYDFKFADAGWSPGFNCGFLTKADELVVSNGPAVSANCNSNGSYFRFNPKHTGTYGFYFDQSADVPVVYIKPIKK